MQDPKFPATLDAPAGRFRLDGARFALRGDVPAGLEGRVEDRLEGESIAIVRGATRSRPVEPSAALPVYVLGEGGAAFVPTGRATVRFRAGQNASAHADALRSAGYRIVEVPPYAPQMAWVESADGDVASALANLDALARLPDVEHVEPQLLSCGERR